MHPRTIFFTAAILLMAAVACSSGKPAVDSPVMDLAAVSEDAPVYF